MPPNSTYTEQSLPLLPGQATLAGDDIFFEPGNKPAKCCCEWFVSLCRCLSSPCGWLKCCLVGFYQCCCWSCPRTSLWDVVIYSLRFVAYAVSAANLRDGVLQAVVDLTPIADGILSVWLGGGVSRCAVSAKVQPADTLGGKGEWLWPSGTGRENDTAPPLPEANPRVILYLHGGAFVLCNSATHRVITYELVRRTKCTVVVPDYSRPPHSLFPKAVDEMVSIYKQLVSYYGASNVILAGDSAGGNLCLTTAIKAVRDEGLEAPGGIVLISPWCDLTEASVDALSMTTNEPTDYLPIALTSRFAEDYVANGNLRSNPLVSPVFADVETLKAACPRVFHCYGTGEELMDQNRALRANLEAAGGMYEALELEGMPHVSPLFAAPVYGASPASEGGEDVEAAAGGGNGGDDVPPAPVQGLNAIAAYINGLGRAAGPVCYTGVMVR
jgi:acetyl esterase/lipase